MAVILGGLTAVGVPVANADAGDHAAAYDEFYRQKVSWSACDDRGLPLDCTGVTVPIDWARPNGSTITLKVRRHKATGTHHGSLLTNPGGPGVSGVRYLAEAARTWSDAVTSGFDLVSWDPRGVGESAPLTCPDEADAALRTVDSSPDTLAERKRQEAAVRTWVRQCRAASGPLFDHVDTLSNVRDLDVLRAVLGEAKLSFLGTSYGTRIGIRYADTFPTRIGRMVLDSAVDPASDNKAFLNGQARGVERALDDYLAGCADRAGCPFSEAQGRAEVAELLRAADSRPPEQEELVNMMAALLRSPRYWPGLDGQLAKIQAGDHSAIQPTDAVDIVNLAINCQDLPDHRTAQQVLTDAKRTARSRPVFGYEFTSGTMCPLWPNGGVVKPRPVTARGSVPILVIGTTRDPATPYEWARSTAKHLANGRLLTRDGSGHAAYGDNACVTEAVDRYLLDAVLPAAGTVCAG
jgi:pimeloyl-ACP methyl ester carboxylesterase